MGTFQQFLKPLIRLDAIVASKKHVQGLRKLGLCLKELPMNQLVAIDLWHYLNCTEHRLGIHLQLSYPNLFTNS